MSELGSHFFASVGALKLHSHAMTIVFMFVLLLLLSQLHYSSPASVLRPFFDSCKC